MSAGVGTVEVCPPVVPVGWLRVPVVPVVGWVLVPVVPVVVPGVCPVVVVPLRVPVVVVPPVWGTGSPEVTPAVFCANANWLWSIRVRTETPMMILEEFFIEN